MATYFDSGSDTALLKSGHRTHSDLATVAAVAEADVIGKYTERPPEVLYTARIGNNVNGLATGAVGRFEDVSSAGLPETSTAPELRVYLLGYKTDSAHADVDPQLRTALKRTIADVINWRLSLLTKDAAVESASDDKKSRSYAVNAQDDFPPDWDKRLIPFDSREGLIGL